MLSMKIQIKAYVERLGINSSLIRPHYELPIDMVGFSRKKKSRQGITIRKNKQPVSIDQSSNSHVNRTDSAHSNNVRSASNMIPCFPANNSTDVHHCDIVSSHSSPSHFTKDTPFNTSQVRTRSTTKKLNHRLENQKGYYLRKRNSVTAPTALHSDYMPERPKRRSRMWAAGSRGSGSSELDIPSEISIYSDHGGDHFEPNIRLEEHNFSRGQSSNRPHDARASIRNTDGQFRDILLDMDQMTLMIKSEILSLM